MDKLKRQKREENQPYHHGDLRAALIKAAASLIDQHGIKGFSLKDAAALAGVSVAAPYRHFADKEALLYALQGEGFRLFNASLAAAYARGITPGSRIVELGVAYVLFALHNPAHFRVMFGLVGGTKTEGDPDQSSGFLLLVDAVEALQPQMPPEIRNDLVVGCWSLVHGFALLQMEGAFAGSIEIGDPEYRVRRALTVMLEKPPVRESGHRISGV
jgi:AcrR family transcriptional regulator